MGIAADFVLIVVAGLIGGLLARALRLPLLVGYVVAGIFVGPHTAGPTVVQIHDIELLAEIGVALLLFSLGLEISFRHLQPVRRVALLAGPLQTLLITVAGAAGAQYFLRMPSAESIWFGAMISVSSTMVVLKTLAAAGVTSTLASRVMIGLLLIQDLAVIPMLIILPQLASPQDLLPNLARSLALAAAFLAAVVVTGRYLLPRLLRFVLQWGSRELFLVAVVAIGIGTGFATHSVGISFALGAFVAGIVLSESEFSHQALSDITPLRDLFGLLFFVTVGMLFDPAYALSHVGQIAATVAAIIAIKSLVMGVTTRAFGYGNMAPWIVGLGLSQIGEFSFVLARSGISGGFLSKPTYDLVLTCTIVTMALSPIVSSAALPLGRVWRRWHGPLEPANMAVTQTELTGHVIVAGYGKTGTVVARSMQLAGQPLLVVESNHALLADLHSAGLQAIWGDVTSHAIQHAAGMERARLLVLTMPDMPSVGLAAQEAKRSHPGLPIIARAVRKEHVPQLHSIGVTAAVQPEFEGGLAMVRQAFLQCEQDHAAADAVLDQLRRELYDE